MNKVMLFGNLGQDPEVRYSQGGSAVANLSVATSEYRKGSDGKGEKYSEWHRVVVFGKIAELCGEYLTKGSKVAVEGRLQTRKWTDRDGNDKWTTEIVANSVEFGSGKGEQRPASKPQQQDDGFDPDVDVPF